MTNCLKLVLIWEATYFEIELCKTINEKIFSTKAKQSSLYDLQHQTNKKLLADWQKKSLKSKKCNFKTNNFTKCPNYVSNDSQHVQHYNW